MPHPGAPWEIWETLPREQQLSLICQTISDRHGVPAAIIRRGRPWHRGISQARMYAIRVAYELLDTYTTADLCRDFHLDLADALRNKQKSRALPGRIELTEIMNEIAGRLTRVTQDPEISNRA